MLANKLIGIGSASTPIEFAGHTSSSGSTYVYLPSSVFQAGDLVFFMDIAGSAFGTPSKIIPSGWTELTTATFYSSLAGHRITITYKILSSGDLDANVTGMGSTVFNSKTLFGFRSSNTISSITSAQVYAETSHGPPTTQSISAYSTYPYLVIGGLNVGTTETGDFNSNWYDDIEYSVAVAGDTTAVAYKIFSNSGQALSIGFDYSTSGTGAVEFFSAVIFPQID